MSLFQHSLILDIQLTVGILNLTAKLLVCHQPRVNIVPMLVELYEEPEGSQAQSLVDDYLEESKHAITGFLSEDEYNGEREHNEQNGDSDNRYKLFHNNCF
jgi:hypothetical protein